MTKSLKELLTQIVNRQADRRLSIIRTTYSIGTQTINAHSGYGFNVPITVPSGYHLVGNIDVYSINAIGLIGGFDGNATTANPVPVYLNNTTNNAIGTSSVIVNVLSLIEKD